MSRAPEFYQTCHDLTAAGRADDIAMEHAIAVLRRMRRGGDPLSTADAIAVTHHAVMLARLRGRNHATLDDIEEALITCCCKGNPAEEGVKLRQAMDGAGIGTKIGKVTPALGRLPIVDDFHVQVQALDLGEALSQERRQDLRLDKRDALDARRSALLHRLTFLDVPFAAISSTGGDFSGTIFREHWADQVGAGYRAGPDRTEPLRRHDRVGGAGPTPRGDRRGRVTNAGRTCERLVQAVDMDLPELVQVAEDAGG